MCLRAGVVTAGVRALHQPLAVCRAPGVQEKVRAPAKTRVEQGSYMRMCSP